MSGDEVQDYSAAQEFNSKVLALLTVLAAIILLASAGTTWTQEQIDIPFSAGTADGATGADGAPAPGETVVVERIETTSGAELAGSLFTVGLASMALAGPLIRWRRTGYALIVAAIAGVVITASAWPSTGSVTTAPSISIAACLGLAAVGLLAVRPPKRSTRPGRPTDHRPEEPSRYTVEAVRGDPGATEDEWDAAVLDDVPDSSAVSQEQKDIPLSRCDDRDDVVKGAEDHR